MIWLINLLVIWGLQYSFEPNEIFGGIAGAGRRFLTPKGLAWMNKPLFDCVMCMSSFWSIPFYIHAVLFHDYDWYYWPVYVLSLAGASFIIKSK